MQDMFENAKRVASTAVERAAWEADRVRRTSARQREIDLLKRERSAVVEQLAGVLLDLERRGELTQAPLQAIATRLRTLTDDVNQGDTDITAIRNETFVPGTISINVQRKDDPNAMPSKPAARQQHYRVSVVRTQCAPERRLLPSLRDKAELN